MDSVEISVKAGKGGNGLVSFQREKFHPFGGPDGGDGGKGGDVYLVSNENISSLSDFQFKRIFRAGNGGNGEGSNKTGRSGDDLSVFVPVGTLVSWGGAASSVVHASVSYYVIGDIDWEKYKCSLALTGIGLIPGPVGDAADVVDAAVDVNDAIWY